MTVDLMPWHIIVDVLTGHHHSDVGLVLEQRWVGDALLHDSYHCIPSVGGTAMTLIVLLSISYIYVSYTNNWWPWRKKP